MQILCLHVGPTFLVLGESIDKIMILTKCDKISATNSCCAREFPLITDWDTQLPPPRFLPAPRSLPVPFRNFSSALSYTTVYRHIHTVMRAN